MIGSKQALSKSTVFGLALGLALWSDATGFDAERVVERYLSETAKNPRAIAAWTKLSEARLWLAAESGDLNQVALAESAVTNALEIDSTDVPALNQMSRVRSAQHRFEDVLHIQRRSIFFGFTNAESWGIAGDAYMDLGRYRSADSCYYTMYELDPGFDSLVRVSRRMFDIGDFDEAVRYLGAAIDTATADLAEGRRRDVADACVRLGKMHLSRGDWERAATLMEKALEMCPDYASALANKALLLRFEHDSIGSKRILHRLVATSKDPRYTSALARVYADEGDMETVDSLVHVAADEYETMFERYPVITRRAYVRFLLEWNRDLAKALRLAYEESRERRDVYTYDLLAWAYHKNEKYDLAWSSIALSLRKDAKHPRIIYHAAAIAKAAGKREKFETYSQKVRGLNPKFERMYGPL